MSLRRAGAVLALCTLVSGIVVAQTRISTELGSSLLLIRSGSSWGAAMLGEGSLSASLDGVRGARAELRLSATVGDIPVLDLDRIFVRTVLGQLRVTVGRSPASWGEGLLANAADLVNRDYNPASELAAVDLRDLARDQLGLRWNFGRLSFAEALLLPRGFPVSLLLTGNPESTQAALPAALPDLASLGRAARVYATLGSFTGQLAWLWEGSNVFGASLTWPLLFDWYAATSLELHDIPGQTDQSWFSDLRASTGILDQRGIGISWTLTSRLEYEIRVPEAGAPSQDWIHRVIPLLAIAPSRTTSATLRAIVDPVDPSVAVAGILQWSPLQGISFLLVPSAQFGADGSSFPADGPGSTAVALGVRALF